LQSISQNIGQEKEDKTIHHLNTVAQIYSLNIENDY